MRYEVKAISIWSFVKVSFFFHLFVSPLFGLFFPLFIGSIVAIAEEFGDYAIDEPASSDAGAFIGLLIMFFLFSILYTALATFCSLIFAWIYNIIAKLLGGLVLDLELIEEKKESIFVVKKDPVTTYLAQTPPPQFSAPAASDIVSTDETGMIEESDVSGKKQLSDSDDSENNDNKKSEDNDHEGDRPQV